MPLPPDEPRRQHDDLAYHSARYPNAPFIQQVDETVAFIVRDLPQKIGTDLRQYFPVASRALPTARWKQIGWVALALLGANWLITLEPAAGQTLLGFSGLALAGYAGWSVLRHSRDNRSSETARLFTQHSAQLGAQPMEQRIAALAALDQLAYDNPRYRRPLRHLLAAWLEERSRDAQDMAGGHDCAVARQMLAEFWQMEAEAASGGDGPRTSVAPPQAADVPPAATAAAAASAAPPELSVIETEQPDLLPAELESDPAGVEPPAEHSQPEPPRAAAQ